MGVSRSASASPRGAERALVRDLAAPAERGTAFGWFHMLVGLAAIPAGLLLGGLWAFYGVKLAFLVSATFAAVACAASGVTCVRTELTGFTRYNSAGRINQD